MRMLGGVVVGGDAIRFPQCTTIDVHDRALEVVHFSSVASHWEVADCERVTAEMVAATPTGCS